VSAEDRVTYRSVLANREFTAILLSQTLSVLGDQVARIALALVVFEKTHSALAASATYGAAFLSYMLAGPVLSALADRFARRGVMVTSDVVRALIVAALAAWQPPVPIVFVAIVLLGIAGPAFDSARSATLPDLLPGDAYVKGNALYNVAFQGAQVIGFLLGGALLTSFTPGQVLAFDAGTYLVSAGAILGMVLSRPAVGEREPTSVFEDTLLGVRLVLGNPTLRTLLGFALLGTAVVAAPEGLAIPIAAELKGTTFAAGLLTASVPAGFVVGTFLVLRVTPTRRPRLLAPLTALSAAPLLLTPWLSTVPLVLTAWFVSGIGASLQVVASAAYVRAAPQHARARAYGLASTGIMGVQGLTQLVAGSAATGFGTDRGSRAAVATVAAVVLLLVLPLGRSTLSRLSGTEDLAQGTRKFVR
jgi:MFS family permease